MESTPRTARRILSCPRGGSGVIDGIPYSTAEREMQRVSEYDYVIVNHRDRLDQALEDLKAIIRGERLRVCRRLVTV